MSATSLQLMLQRYGLKRLADKFFKVGTYIAVMHSMLYLVFRVAYILVYTVYKYSYLCNW